MEGLEWPCVNGRLSPASEHQCCYSSDLLGHTSTVCLLEDKQLENNVLVWWAKISDLIFEFRFGEVNNNGIFDNFMLENSWL